MLNQLTMDFFVQRLPDKVCNQTQDNLGGMTCRQIQDTGTDPRVQNRTMARLEKFPLTSNMQVVKQNML
jgi:hypothetical protein